ncbi:MAG: MoaD/ThiS family protein [Armatimonadota bacterium]|nr:MoaD/ThiS family protein [Armatimonadota bacterium]MDR7518465.1 MoaD/ThiS family protein [Armatimonadota bacterium]MDR7522014.1 MoaD/ThiS family protein [Armatimonadota bacterium]MDR7550559.1 MoaD/ThiS family protein [Armatimonadota bacterium]
MATIRIPTPLRRYTNGERQITVTADTVASAIAELDRRFPGVRSRLLDADGQIHRFVTIFVGEQDVRLLAGLATPLDEQAEVSIIPAMAGG